MTVGYRVSHMLERTAGMEGEDRSWDVKARAQASDMLVVTGEENDLVKQSRDAGSYLSNQRITRAQRSPPAHRDRREAQDRLRGSPSRHVICGDRRVARHRRDRSEGSCRPSFPRRPDYCQAIAHITPTDQHDEHPIDPVPMQSFGRRPADMVWRGLDLKLVEFNAPARARARVSAAEKIVAQNANMARVTGWSSVSASTGSNQRCTSPLSSL